MENNKESGIVAVELASDDDTLFVAGAVVGPLPASRHKGTCTLTSIIKRGSDQ